MTMNSQNDPQIQEERLVHAKHAVVTSDLNETQHELASSSSSPSKVQFALHENRIKLIQHYKEMDSETSSNIWYNKRDYDTMRKVIAPIVKKMSNEKQPESLESSRLTTRGLEYRTPEGAQARQLNKKKSVVAVIEEQHLQTYHKKVDDEKLRRAYLQVAAQCQLDAQALGKKDEAAIKDELELMRRSLQKQQLNELLAKGSGHGKGLSSLFRQRIVRTSSQVRMQQRKETPSAA